MPPPYTHGRGLQASAALVITHWPRPAPAGIGCDLSPPEHFKLRLTPVEVFSHPGNLCGEHAVTREFSSQAPVALSIGMLHDEVVVRGRWVEEGQEPWGKGVDGPFRIAGSGV